MHVRFIRAYIIIINQNDLKRTKFKHGLNFNYSPTCGNKIHVVLTKVTLLSPVGNLCKQFGPRQNFTKCQARSGSKLFDTDGIPVREIEDLT